MIEVEECPKEEKQEEEDDDDDNDDSEDEDWGKNAVLENVVDDNDDEDMELEEENEVVESAKGKNSNKVEPKKRKLGGGAKMEPMKKSKSGNEVNRVAVKLSPLAPLNNLEGE